MEIKPHYFWAVRLPDSIKQYIQDEMTNVKQIFKFKRWVHMDDYHITLVFLGSVDQQKTQSVIDLVGDAIKDEKAFELQIEGLNVFGNNISPRIFWGAVNHETKLHQLQAVVHKKCQEAGFTLENRPYHPHITLARNWTGNEEFDRGLLQKHNPFYEEALSFQANEIVLYKSNLEKTPKYEPVATFSLLDE
ncbi:RNA 2',3'-cyclic phosphodiesterase [Solibacillus sp. FSL H8-0538]|uniref:RNA 2',3'-cyclic phosphodiesterase n=1 Tax=Solibacillus sp. FSL H8-0538 TaxID=2921400 RepID=UPI0030F95786